MRLMTLVVRLALCGAVIGLTACSDDGGSKSDGVRVAFPCILLH